MTMTDQLTNTDILDQLTAVIKARRSDASAETSYAAKILSKGKSAAAKKLGEEATEVVIAALSEGPEAVKNESADLLFHLLLLLELEGVTIKDVLAVLEARMGLSGIVEKNNRPQS